MRSLFFSALLLAAVALAAQAGPSEVEITAEPHHHLGLENAYVRVTRVEVQPGDATLLHRHRHDYVFVILGPSQTTTEVAGKPPMTTKLQDGETHFTEGNFAHVVRNIGSTPFRNVTVEFMQDAQARKSAPPWDEERGLRVLEGGTQDIMFVKDGVRVSEVDLQPHGMIPKHHHAGPHLVIAITDVNLRSDVVGKGPSNVELKAGEIQWVPGGFTHTLMNQGHQEAKYITMQFH